MENRRYERLDSGLSADIFASSDKVIAASAENLCQGGVCFTLESALPKGTVVGLSMFPVDDGIEDPDAEPFNVPARVVWCNRKIGERVLVGMRFVTPSNDSQS